VISVGTFTSFDEGWFLPKYSIFFMSLAQILFYIFFTGKNIILIQLRNQTADRENQRFIYTFFCYLLLLLIPPIGAVYSDYSGNNPASPILLTYISSQLIFFLLLFTQPKFLYAKVKSLNENLSTASIKPLQKKEFFKPMSLYVLEGIDIETKQHLEEIETYFEQEKPFLKLNFDQNDLCEKLNLSGYQIRNTLKKSYAISFSDFVNFHRIQFLIKMLEEDKKWKNYTMASLAQAIGFKSTNSLYLAFKRFLKTTPKEYIDQINR
jgi:AraC-like DNA-binding protein